MYGNTKIGNDGNIANFVHLWKTRIESDSNRFNIDDKNLKVFNWNVVSSTYNLVFNNIFCLIAIWFKPGWPGVIVNTTPIIYICLYFVLTRY